MPLRTVYEVDVSSIVATINRRTEYQAANWLEKILIEHREALHDHETNGSWYVVPGWLR